MLTARERVVPALGEGAWWRCAVAGAAVGLLIGVTSPWTLKWLDGPVYRVIGAPLMVREATIPLFLFLVTFAPAMSLLLMATQRVAVVAAVAASLSAATLTGLICTVLVRRGDGGAGLSAALDSRAMYVALGWICAFVVASAVMLGMQRALLTRLVEHRPGMCRRCGYTLGSEAIGVCPECGAAVKTAPFRNSTRVAVVAWSIRRCGRLATIAAATFLLINTWPFLTRTLPSARFYAEFSAAVRVPRGAPSIYVDADLPTVWIAHPEMSDRGTRVVFDPISRSIMVDIVGTPASGMPLGAAHIVSDLNVRQSEWVIRHGLPKGLVDDLYAKAAEVAWMPASAPRGEWNVAARDEWFAE